MGRREGRRGGERSSEERPEAFFLFFEEMQGEGGDSQGHRSREFFRVFEKGSKKRQMGRCLTTTAPARHFNFGLER